MESNQKFSHHPQRIRQNRASNQYSCDHQHLPIGGIRCSGFIRRLRGLAGNVELTSQAVPGVVSYQQAFLQVVVVAVAVGPSLQRGRSKGEGEKRCQSFLPPLFHP